ncbi:ABC transporter ATP-binding protein [Methylobacterium nonmethylotrophicum]|uniref:ABC transporter ATP-binding protein n=1 Tax=Methylobacterium nonmethylotrophicum TaxID=1141884 RepID=UPI00197B944F|nr:ABC transporter ATP-binding protein [Methylobacterium nonmethylotrophicum]
MSAAARGVEPAPLIEARGLGKTYETLEHRSVHALSDASFTVRDGEFVSIVGPSGCGKSTLLKIMAGLLPSTAGTLHLAGRTVTGPSPEIGVVFQRPLLLPWRTILQNVLFPAEIRGVPPSHIRDRASSLLDLVGLGGVESRYPHELSGGMQQRAAIVRALVQDPTLLLMDEPFGALDALTRERMNVETLRIWDAQRKTVVFVTHSIGEAVFLSDRVLVMTPQPGRIARVVAIDLARPRTLSMMGSAAFAAHAGLIREHLDIGRDLDIKKDLVSGMSR